MKESVPLNNEQRQFATDHHSLVYAFLNQKKLTEDGYYDVVIFGYLQAVRDYLENPDLQQYSFTTIAWKQMNHKLFDYYKTRDRPKRNARTVSLYAVADSSGFTWEEILAGKDDCMVEFEIELMLHDLAKQLPRRQMSVIRQKADGYGIREIAKRENIAMRTVKMLLEDAYDIVAGVCCQ